MWNFLPMIAGALQQKQNKEKDRQQNMLAASQGGEMNDSDGDEGGGMGGVASLLGGFKSLQGSHGEPEGDEPLPGVGRASKENPVDIAGNRARAGYTPKSPIAMPKPEEEDLLGFGPELY